MDYFEDYFDPRKVDLQKFKFDIHQVDRARSFEDHFDFRVEEGGVFFTDGGSHF